MLIDEAQLVWSPDEGSPPVELEEGEAYLLLTDRGGYGNVAAEDCSVGAESGVEALEWSVLNIRWESQTFFTFGELTAGEESETQIDCGAPEAAVVITPVPGER